jgi:hypothetical protein
VSSWTQDFKKIQVSYRLPISAIELILDLKNRKKLKPTSIARPAVSAASIFPPR